MLNPLELTGRARTHVREDPELSCALHPQVLPALAALAAAARADGIEVAVVSGYRDLKRQVSIWNAKLRGERPLLDRDGRRIERSLLSERDAVDTLLLWSALPGASRHHWGSDLDVIDRAALPQGQTPQLTAQEFASEGVFARLSAWLTRHADRFGFFRPYATYSGGVMPEPWHLSYAEVAVPALSSLTVEILAEAIAVTSMDARDQVLARLPELYERFVLVRPPER
ncbi:MAG TPA: M15 family metallopeptidase [Steroidobacteraceae bacterium]|nr:M15 family metallopeptidase [Steroidobacteraceae bacterium]